MTEEKAMQEIANMSIENFEAENNVEATVEKKPVSQFNTTRQPRQKFIFNDLNPTLTKAVQTDFEMLITEVEGEGGGKLFGF